MTLTLYPYQEVALDHLRRNDRAGLFLDMGLGKTAITLRALEPRHLPALVVAPKRVTEYVWPEEAALWRPDLDLRVAAGNHWERRAALESGADVVAIGRDNVADVSSAHPFKTIIMDESSSFKNRSTKRWKNMRRLCKSAPHRWALTGTPSPNGLLDLWPQLFLLDDGKRLGSTITGFRNRYFSPGQQLRSGVITRWDLRPGSDEHIHRQIEDICLSMSTDGRVELPPVTVNRVPVPLPAAAKKAYEDMVRDLVADLRLLGGEIHSAANAAALTTKLSQLTSGFIYSDNADVNGGKYTQVHDAKMEVLREIVELSGSPVLVFYRFKAELDALKKCLPGAATLSMPNVIKHWNEGKLPVLLAHPASAGHGLNLQHGGHTVVWTTPTWSLEEDMQANKRLARNGQKNPVVIHYLVAPGTVDESVLSRLKNKTSVHAALMDHLESVL